MDRRTYRIAAVVILLVDIAVAVWALAAPPDTAEAKIARVRAYTQALAARDYDKAKRFLAPGARVFFEKKEGDGDPLRPGAGKWTRWDDYFHGKTSHSDWRVEGDTVVAAANESNDFYRLLDWRPEPMRFTWWLDGEGRITAFLVQSVPDGRPTGSRLKEAVAWAKEKHPEEIAYLMRKDDIDPTEDRADRWRKLLVEWRRAAGLPEIAIEAP